LRHGLSFARRSATRFSPGPFTTGPNPRAPLVGRARSGNAHGISSALRSIPWRRVPAFLRFIPTCRFALRASHKSPADFYGRPVAHVSSFPIRKVFQMRPAFANGATPTDFWVVLPRPSRAGAPSPVDCFQQSAASLARARQSCHGLRGLLSGMSDAVSAARHRVLPRSPSSA
jgi:hypothetical protein